MESIQTNIDEVNLDLIVEGFGIHEKNVLGEVLKENVIGSLNNKMKDIHIISSQISQTSTSTVMLPEEQEPSVIEVHAPSDGCIPAEYSDVVKIILNLDENREDGEIGWETTSENPNFSFENTTLSMKSCIQQFNLDPLQCYLLFIHVSIFE
jgi:hypothetical protein